MDKVVLYLIGIFFVLGGLDYMLGSPLKLGGKFEEGIKTMGVLGLGMIGIYSLAPTLSNYLYIIVTPISKLLRLDPSLFPSALLAVDMGGYQLATKLAADKTFGLFSAVAIASTLGTTVSFSIPVALGMISKEDQVYFSKGVMVGIVSTPIGCLTAGIWQKININMLIWNLVPIFVFAFLLGLGLVKYTDAMIKAFSIFGKFITILSITGLLLQGITVIFEIKIINGLAPLSESAFIVGKTALILGGAYPMLEIIKRVFSRSLDMIGKRMGINSVAAAGILGNLASNLVVFGAFKEMNSKGKVICTAFAVSGSFVFGGQFGFVSGIAPEMVGAFIISKFTAGIISIILAMWLYERETKLNLINDNGGLDYGN